MAMDHGLLVHAVVFLLLASTFNTHIEAQGIGVNYGLLGDNLPAPDKVIALCKSRGIQKLRLFNPNLTVLNALQGSGIKLILGTLNQDLPKLATDPTYAASWVQANVIPYANSIPFQYISAGNEVVPGDLANYVLSAMQNLYTAVQYANLTIPVTTSISMNVLGTSYPPSQGAFSSSSTAIMAQIAAYLDAKNTPLLVNVYPYFAYANNPNDVRLDYALFTAQKVVVQDGALGYTNIFDAMVDSMYAALEKAGGPSVDIVVSETGWPSGGGGAEATIENAMVYNNNVRAHAATTVGTPKRPGKAIEAYLFAMFNENLKPAGIEQHWGMFQPNMSEVYHVNFIF